MDRRLLYRGLKSLFLLNARNCGYGRIEDLGCAVVSQGIVVMREWKIKDAQWSFPWAWYSVTKRYNQFHMKL